MKIYKPNFGIVELCLTYRCNVKCDNCSNLCTQAPDKGDLTPEMIETFLNDNRKAGHKIGMITLHGGEPVLNPFIYDIVKLLTEYRAETGCNLWLLTNNSSDYVRKLVTRISINYNIPLGVSSKKDRNITNTGSPIEYVPVNESPDDLGISHENGCFQTENCGICYNDKGYFPCSPMAAAARVFGYIGCNSITELTDEKCQEYFSIHCKHCGFSAPERKRVINQATSPTWESALNKYQLTRKDCRHELISA